MKQSTMCKAIEVIQFGQGQRQIHSNRCHAAILSGKKHGWHGRFVFITLFKETKLRYRKKLKLM